MGGFKSTARFSFEDFGKCLKSQLESASSSVTRMATEGAKATASGVEAQVVGAAASGPNAWLFFLIRRGEGYDYEKI